MILVLTYTEMTMMTLMAIAIATLTPATLKAFCCANRSACHLPYRHRHRKRVATYEAFGSRASHRTGSPGAGSATMAVAKQ